MHGIYRCKCEEMRQKEELPQRKQIKSIKESSRRRLDDELLRLFPGELGATEVTVASSLEVNRLLEVELANYGIPVRSARNWYQTRQTYPSHRDANPSSSE